MASSPLVVTLKEKLLSFCAALVGVPVRSALSVTLACVSKWADFSCFMAVLLFWSTWMTGWELVPVVLHAAMINNSTVPRVRNREYFFALVIKASFRLLCRANGIGHSHTSITFGGPECFRFPASRGHFLTE